MIWAFVWFGPGLLTAILMSFSCTLSLELLLFTTLAGPLAIVLILLAKYEHRIPRFVFRRGWFRRVKT